MSWNELGDEQLMASMATGNSAALEALYDRYAASVMGLALKILNDRAAAEEVVQETFWRIWQQVESFDAARGEFRSWMFTIAHRLSIDIVRRRQARPQPVRDESDLYQLNANPDPGEGVAEIAWMAIQRQRVRAAMTALPSEQRQVIELAYFRGLTRREIAEATGQPLGTIHTRARLALQKLRQQLQEDDLNES